MPQCSVLGPIVFKTYTVPINRTRQRRGVSYHTYADDVQICVSLNPNIKSDKERECIRKTRKRMLLHRLMVNNGKTEVIHFKSKHNNTKFGNDVSCLVSVGSNNIIPASPVRNMGVIM